MHPVLLDIGTWQITSYGFALTMAFAIGIILGASRTGRFGLPLEPVLGVSIVIVVSSIVGSRIFHSLTSPALAGGSWTDALNPFASGTGIFGLSVMGGLPAALVCAWLYLVVRGLPVLAYMDLLAPSVALGAGITRIGCFLNGCCHGAVCDLPWAVRFPAGSIPFQSLGAVSIHPTQLYQSALGFALAGLLLVYATRRPPPGAIVSALVVGFGLQRIWAEALRFQSPDEVWFRTADLTVSVYQGAALVLVLVGVAGWAAASRRRPRAD